MRGLKSLSYLTFHGAALMALMFLVSCGKNETKENSSLVSGKVIIGDLNWADVQFLNPDSAEFANSKRVAYLDIPAVGARCTAFLIGPDILMTNEHCITQSADARGAVASFNHVTGAGVSEYKIFKCDQFVGNNSQLDFALLRCQGRPGDIFGYVTLDGSGMQKAGQEIYVVQQNCDYYTLRNCDPSKKIAYGVIQRLSDEYVHNADTLGGSSGSAVFDSQNHKVFALHHVGVGNDGSGRGSENHAVPMSKIVPYLKQYFPSVLASAQTASSPSADLEPNDSFLTAAKIATEQKFSGLFEIKKQDVDFYKVSLHESKHLFVSIGFWHAIGDLDLKIYDQNKNQIGVSQGMGNGESLSVELEAGEYTIMVYGYNNAQAQYNFLVQVY